MKIRKSEFRNILDNGFKQRREAAKERQKKASEAVKRWKKQQTTAGALLERLGKSENPSDQADAFVLKEMMKKIKYDFGPKTS